MDLKELENLPRRTDGFFDLTIPFINEAALSPNQFICDRKHNGRMDLVSLDIYGSVEYKMLLCGVNNFLNEFSIKEGDVLFYPNLDDIDSSRSVQGVVSEDDRANLIDAMKRAAQDPARTKYLKDRKVKESLPTPIQPIGRQQVESRGDKIKLSPGFGNTPTTANTGVGTSQNTGTGTAGTGNGIDDSQNAAGKERILVRKFYTK